MARVLVVDDEEGLRDTMAQFLERDGHVCLTAESVEAALVALAGDPVDVVVTDIVMPGRSGMDLLQEMNALSLRCQVIVVTGEPTVETASDAVRAGAFDYVPKPVSRARLTQVVAAAVRLKKSEDENDNYRENLERLVESRTGSLNASVERLKRTLENTTQALSAAVEIRDLYTAGHQRRVARLAGAIHQKLGRGADEGAGLRIAGLLHDFGKLAIPAEILAKPSRLSAIEFALIQQHPITAWEILKGLDFDWPVAEIVRQHHERLDGSGYPDQLKGDDIRFEARILAVADTVEAMASHRPYRPALGLDVALEEISRGRGTRFEAEVVDACLELFRDDGMELADD